MPAKIEADARPQKRLFVSLITRDISLADALLDLIDNSINAALEPIADNLKTADDYQRLLANSRLKAKVDVSLTISSTRIYVEDTAHGISLRTARDQVFRFGRDAEPTHSTDRLSVYGIGLKRALFKCGNRVEITSDHRDGGFELKEDIRRWCEAEQEHWHFEITPRAATKNNLGTRITIGDLHDDVKRRLGDGIFISQLRDRISRTYSFFIGRIVNITVNGEKVEGDSFEIGQNFASEKFQTGTVSCNITAGIPSTKREIYPDKNAGWFVFCNGRTVLYADKSQLTGWGSAGGLPIFQPKHRPFLGIVFFVSPDPEALPWTTTKGSVNEESGVWQIAKRHMIKVGRVITSFLDSRYSDDSGAAAPPDLLSVAGTGVSVLSAAVASERAFKPPKTSAPKTMKIQYDANVGDVKKIENYLRRPGMGGSEVGRYTFQFFLKNEIKER